MKKPINTLLFALILFIPQLHLLAQTPTVQDCLGAIPVCQDTFMQTNAFSGTGNYPGEITFPLSCLQAGEKNDVWYIFRVQQTGILNFSITPVNPNDDYDWAIFDLTGHTCNEIATVFLQVSCNYAGNNGNQGVTGANGGVNQQSSPTFTVLSGNTYVLNISNYTSTQDGYLLDFSASTAQLYDTITPFVDSTTALLYYGDTTFTAYFSENIYCSTVQPTDFSFTGPGGTYTITSVAGTSCNLGADYGNIFNFSFSPPISAAGVYTLSITDTIFDLCYIPPVLPSNISLRTCSSPSTINPISCNSYLSPSHHFTWNISGSYMDTIPNSLGCDSIITINLTINHPSASTQTISACEKYTSPSGNFIWMNSGIFTDIIPNAGGCDSMITFNLTILNSTSSTQTIVTCDEFVSPSGNYTWTASGQYSDTITNSNGCDSIIAFILTINNVNITITQNNSTLISNATGAQYQWLDCDNNFSAIGNATNQFFNASQNGNYACVITLNGCTDTSVCYTVTGVGVNEFNSQNCFEIFPNPATNQFTIELKNYHKPAEITIRDILGKEIYSVTQINKRIVEINTKYFTEGIYTTEVKSDGYTEIKKLIIAR